MPCSAVDFLWKLHSRLEKDDDLFAFVLMLTETRADFIAVREELAQLQKILSSDSVSFEHQHRLLTKATRLKALATPLWETWLAQSTTAHLDGLLQLRCQLLKLKSQCDEHPLLAAPGAHTAESGEWARRRAAVHAVDAAMLRLFKEWFASARLTMRELTWDTTSGAVLELILQAERVHPFDDLSDIKHRMQQTPNRHLFAMEHADVEGPVVAVQVALTHGIETSVDRILKRRSPVISPDEASAVSDCAAPDTAMFYSINSTKEALRGVDMGNALIKQVVAGLQQSSAAAKIRRFSTLSPIPGYLQWLRTEAAKLERGQQARVFGQGRPEAEERGYRQLQVAFNGPQLTQEQLAVTLVGLLEDDAQWWWDKEFAEHLRQPLLTSVAWYLTQERRRNKLLDPVANFHVSNGAQVFQLNWLANCCAKGNHESGCVMVNYLYDPVTVERNAHEYQLHHRVDIGDALRGLTL